MATRVIYLTVRLEVENLRTDKITDEDVNDLVSELDYNFSSPEGDFTIIDTEICECDD